MNDSAFGPVVVSEAEFAERVLRSENPVLVDFWAEWCAPCRALGPVLEALAAEFGDRVTVAKIDVDANQTVAMQYGIRSIPTVMLFDRGQVLNTFIGVRPKSDYEAALRNALG